MPTQRRSARRDDDLGFYGDVLAGLSDRTQQAWQVIIRCETVADEKHSDSFTWHEIHL